MHLAGLDRKLDDLPEATRRKTRAMMLQALQRTGSGLGEVAEIDPPAVKRLGEVKAPTLVIIDEYDHPAVQEMNQFMAEGIPGAETVRLKAGHLPSIDVPDEFTAAVGAFLAKALK
jgi:pimeloyl-ACP methyl ester carboxylesterase